MRVPGSGNWHLWFVQWCAVTTLLSSSLLILVSCGEVLEAKAKASSAGNGRSGIKDKFKEACPPGDDNCDKERVEYESISALHRQIDDDQSGAIDLSESDEFLREELQYTDGFQRHTTFHGDDTQVSIEELWKFWKKSEVHNWTVDDALEWLVVHVELPQYAETFKQNGVCGATLPRIAVNTNNFITSTLGIRNPVHKQKLTLKSMDAVLFGPPKKPHSYIKDLILVGSLMIAMGGCWFAYIQHKNAQSHLKKMIKDLDTLQKAEDSLLSLQDKLDKAQEEQKSVKEEKMTLEQKMKGEIEETKKEAARLREQRQGTEGEINRLKLAEEEIDHLRGLLLQAERQLEDNQFLPTSELQQWLQLTYELELKHYDMKKAAAEKQLYTAKEGCEKIRKKRSAFMGSLRIAHSSGIDDIDQRILEARAALEEVRQDLQERLHRWRQIEVLCGFAITTNPGLSILEHALRDTYATPPVVAPPTSASHASSQGDFDYLTEEDDDILLGGGRVTPTFSPSPMIIRKAGSVRGSAQNLLSVDDVDDEMVPPFKPEPVKHGRFYTLGLAAMYATSYRTKARARKTAQSRQFIPPQTINHTPVAIASRISPVKNMPCRFPTSPSSPGLHSMYPDLTDRRAMPVVRSSENVLKCLPKSESLEDSGHISSGSAVSTPGDGPVKFTIEGTHENGIPERSHSALIVTNVAPKVGHSISVDSALTKNTKNLMRPVLQQTQSESVITDHESPNQRTENINGLLRKRGDGEKEQRSPTPPIVLEENSSEDGSILDTSSEEKKKKRKVFSVKFLKKDKAKKT